MPRKRFITSNKTKKTKCDAIEVKETTSLENIDCVDVVKPIDRNSFAYLNRSSFISVANTLLESASKLSEGLSFMDSVLMDRDMFEESDIKTQAIIHKAISQRAATTFSDIHRILDLAVKSDFNRNFLGITSEISEKLGDSSDESTESMSKDVRAVLSLINSSINRKNS